MERYFADLDPLCFWAKTEARTAMLGTAVKMFKLTMSTFVQKDATTFKNFSAVHWVWVINKALWRDNQQVRKVAQASVAQ